MCEWTQTSWNAEYQEVVVKSLKHMELAMSPPLWTKIYCLKIVMVQYLIERNRDSDGSLSNWGKRIIWILAARMDFQKGGFPCFRRWGFSSLWGWRLKFWDFFFSNLFRLLHIYNDSYWNISFYYNILLFHFLICDNVKVGSVFSHQKCDFLQNYFSFFKNKI